MNDSFDAYVTTAKARAAERGLIWDLPCDELGDIPKASRWNLTKLVGMTPPPSIFISSFGIDAASFRALNELKQRSGDGQQYVSTMTERWRDLYLAAIVHQVLGRKNKPAHSLHVTARWIQVLGAVASETSPWDVTPDQVQLAYNVALRTGESGKNALNFAMTVRTILDDQHLTNTPALARFCTPYASEDSERAHEQAQRERARVNGSSSSNHLRKRLAERKSEAKLPEQMAFWELVRIVFTEQPRTFSDAIRFAVMKILIVTGLRVGEVALLPFDWCRWHDFVDSDGVAAGKKGGISRSLMIRHFAEKQTEDEAVDGISLYENTQHVPPLFEELVLETLAELARLTEPLRERLRQQIKSGRLFPEYHDNDLVPAYEMYVRMTGNARFSDADVPENLILDYRKTFDPRSLEEIVSYQLENASPLAPTWKYFYRARKAGLVIRDRQGNEIQNNVDWSNAFLLVSDAEEHIRVNAPTKLPDLEAASLADGTPVFPHELMFLLPVRNLIEGRNDGVLDATRYFAAGRIDTQDINFMLDGSRPDSIFHRYGATENDQNLSLNPHALRHLQNMELFRLGVADTIITKRFNRRSVAQSYEYDHRSLAEDLARIDVPPEAEKALGDNAHQVYRMIVSGKVSGPLIDEFYAIQRKHGDQAAFDYLNAEADGLHVTPYGFCVNSFSVDPCPKHLECFNGCRHLTRSDVDEEREHLERLRDRMTDVIASLDALPVDQRSIGWKNQLSHAQTRLENILKTLAARPREKPFPDGADLSEPAEKLLGTSVVDTVLPARGRNER
jgi:hypothetical protein